MGLVVLSYITCRKDYPHIVQVADCPQQSNGYDCGVYVLLNAEYLAHQLTLQTSIEKQVNPDDLLKNFNDTSFSITALVADSFRLKIYSEIVLFHEADRQQMEQY